MNNLKKLFTKSSAFLKKIKHFKVVLALVVALAVVLGGARISNAANAYFTLVGCADGKTYTTSSLPSTTYSTGEVVEGSYGVFYIVTGSSSLPMSSSVVSPSSSGLDLQECIDVSGTAGSDSYYVSISSSGSGSTQPSGSVGVYSGNSLLVFALPAGGMNPTGVTFGGNCAGSTLLSSVVSNGDGYAVYKTAPRYSGCLLTVKYPAITQYPLQVFKTGTGSGTVTSSPSGINCGSTCTSYYYPGTSVRLTASPSSNSTFTGWSGHCSGTSTLCTLSVTSSKGAYANFNLRPPIVTVSASPTSVSYGNQSKITWNSSYATSCVRTDTGASIGTSGYFYSGALYSPKTFTITCSN